MDQIRATSSLPSYLGEKRQKQPHLLSIPNDTRIGRRQMVGLYRYISLVMEMASFIF